jgi:hypothetical protein
MKMFLLLVLTVAALFVWQRSGNNDAATGAPPAAKVAGLATPRPIYEHDWAKHSLDRANEVANQVRKVRQENEQP